MKIAYTNFFNFPTFQFPYKIFPYKFHYPYRAFRHIGFSYMSYHWHMPWLHYIDKLAMFSRGQCVSHIFVMWNSKSHTDQWTLCFFILLVNSLYLFAFPAVIYVIWIVLPCFSGGNAYHIFLLNETQNLKLTIVHCVFPYYSLTLFTSLPSLQLFISYG